MSPTDVPDRPDVELRLPADSAWVHVVRTTTAGLAARLDFTIDDIEDLRMAVGEACAVVLEAARPGSDLHCAFRLDSGLVVVTVGVDGAGSASLDEESFAWQVLSTLATSAEADTVDGRFTVTVTMRSELAVPGS